MRFFSCLLPPASCLDFLCLPPPASCFRFSLSPVPCPLSRGDRGISIIGTVFTLIILGVMGASLVALVAGDQESRMDSINREYSFYAVQAGFEYALREINEGGYPVVSGKQLSNATFNVSINPTEKRITAVGQAQNASKTHSITTNRLAADCITIDTTGAYLQGFGGNQLAGITMTKTCLNAVTIDGISVNISPNLSEKVRNIRIGGTEVYNDAAGVGSQVTANINDFRITTSAPLDFIEFSSGMAGKTLTVTLTMSDTSTKASAQMVF